MTKVIRVKGNTYLYGTIIEKGNNNNGTYIKFSDGTMIITQKVTWSGTIDISWGTLYQSEQISLPNFPVSFIEIPTITYSIDGTGKAWLFNNGSKSSKVKAGSVNIVRPTILSSGDFYISVIAIGKWK